MSNLLNTIHNIEIVDTEITEGMVDYLSALTFIAKFENESKLLNLTVNRNHYYPKANQYFM